MKDKPVSHKDKNTFRFLTFSERISKINIDVIHEICEKSTRTEGDDSTFFHEAFEKWGDLNYSQDYDFGDWIGTMHMGAGKECNIDVINEICDKPTRKKGANSTTFFHEAFEKWGDLNHSQDYGDLQEEIRKLFESKDVKGKKEKPKVIIMNLDLIVLCKNELIEILLKYLRKEESLALDAVLALIVALARDLQHEFYPDFPKFFSALVVQLSSTKDTELLEKLFTCLAYLFKFLLKSMVVDFKNVYRLFSTLLSSQNKEHIRIFAVESFAFLIRQVVKKLKNPKKLFSLIFRELQRNPEQSFGVGQLLFEVVKNVQEEFHSCTKNVFKLLLEFLGHDELPCDLIEESLAQTIKAMAKYTTKKHCSIIQNIFCAVIQEILSVADESDSKSHDHLHRVLRLLSLWVHSKGSKLISPDNETVEVLISLCGRKYLPVFCLKTVVEIVATVIETDCLSLSYDKSHAMIEQIYALEPDVFIHFTKKILSYRMFEKDILPNLLAACVNLIKDDKTSSKDFVLQTLAETVISLKSAITSGDCIKSFTKLYFNLPEKNNVLEDFLFQILTVKNISSSDLPNLWAALVCLPHIRCLSSQVSGVLQKLAIHLHQHLLSLDAASSFREREEYSFVLSQVYFAYLITCPNSEEGCFQTPFFIQLLKKYPKSVGILRLADLHFSHTPKPVAVDNLLECLCNLISNLASPFHWVRLFTLRILNALSSYLLGGNEACTIFVACLEAEKVPLDVQSYREKLKWLRKLEYQFLEKEFSGELEEQLIKSVVYYLLGTLFVNFRLLWDPAIDILETYAHGKDKCFWDVFGNYLYEITEMCEKNELPFKEFHDVFDCPENVVYHQCLLQFCKPDENPDVGNHRILLWKAMEKFTDIVEPKNKTVTPLIFRLMTHEMVKVDQTMASKESLHKTSTSVEDPLEDSENRNKNAKRKLKQNTEGSKKRKISNEEVDENGVSGDIDEHGTSAISDSDDDISDADLNEDQVKQNGTVNETDETSAFENFDMSHVSETENRDEDESDDDDDEEEEEEENNQLDEESNNLKSVSDTDKMKRKESSVKRKYSVVKTLAAYLSVFSKFKNPKAIHRSDDLLKLYNELLTYPDPLIQKLSFDCIMTYNFKFLTPYKENFYRILNNKTFKSEVVVFSLDKQNEVIREEDRANVLAFLMRILYGKMLHKTGNNTTGKSQANTRRSLVFRFLGGCSASELKMFFDLVFMPFQELLIEDTLSVVKKIRSGLDLCNIVPLRRQHSALNSLGLILRHLGNLAPELLPWLLKVLLVITSTSMTLLEKRDEVLPWCINLLKSVRTLAVMRLIQFFKTFPKYEFTPDEIDAVFESIVWPMLPRLELDSVKMASPLLRLFCAWSENPRYFVLFSKYHEECKSLTILPHLIALYTSSRAKPRVVGVVSKIIFHLILSKSAAVTEEEEENVAPLKINFSLCEPEDTMTETESITYGMKLLLPFVDNILQRLESTFLVLKKKRSKKVLSQRDLTILLGISPHVENSEQCFKLIHLLVPFLHNPKTDVDPQVFILNTISNLIKKVKDVESFMELFAPLFGKLTNQNSRTALTSIFTTMAEGNKKLAEMAVVINKVNAYDPNIIGEPDYQLRLEGHKEALDIIQSMVVVKGEINVHFIRIVIFNSAFMIRMLDDMALRNSSSSLLVEVTRVVSALQDQKPEKFHLLIFETLLPEIQKGLKCAAEVKRHEFIYVLSAVLDCCKDQSLLKELVALRHQDKDLDFWENIRHLQVHRRARALLRFSNALKNQCENKDKINFSYLLNYMIPIVQSFLFNDAYKKHVHVIDAAIETLGSIASVLSWHHYELLLKQYLDLISKDAEHHKTIVKIIVSLLDAFPFDLRAEKQESTDSTQDESSGTTSITPEMSKKINIAIRRNILPLLHKSLMKKNKSDDEHKLAGHYYPEDDEILRVPIALAMVKLLQKLPAGTMEKALPGLLLKMCELLKSRADSIRQTARETLIKMMQSLGPKYFYFLLKEMKGVMKKGYQIHVMIFTINAVLMNIAAQLTCGDLDDCLKDLTEVCVNELFSDVAEEKEVTKITGKVKEARSTKSYSILQILSKYISESLLMDLIKPLKELLFTKHSHKSLKKISECLRHIAVGLSENSSLSEKGLLVFIHAVINKNVPGLNEQKNKTSSKNVKYERPDIYLVPKEPGRSGPPAKISERTNIHILVEFGLQILQNCLKRDKLSKGVQEILEMLDPFVALLTQCLTSNQVKITTLALRCLLPFYKYPLPSFKEHTKKVIESLFILINKYASPGMGQGENFEMIVMCFKMLTVLVRDTNYHKFTEDQLHSLLSYIEQDIYDYTRQATAFSLLKAILSKKIESSELPGIMSKIAEMAITSEQENVRAQCRQLCMQYMLDYPLGKKLIKSISFFIAQLEYPHEHGRISCMEIVNSMMNMFPENILKQHAALFLVPLSARLVNDESSQCRKMAAQCIKKLLEKVNHDSRAGLFSLAINWLQAKKVSHKRLGAQVCGLFAEVEGEQFEHHLIEILPTYCELIRDAANKEVEKASDERCTDHFLYHLLNSLTKMFSLCQSVLRKPLHSKIFNDFWTELQGVLLYPHMWVRLAVDQLFGLLLSSYSVEEVIEAVSKEDTDVYINSRQKLRDLSADFSTQIQSEYLNEKLGEQVVRNLVYLSRVISALPKGVDDVDVTLSWMIRKMAREAKKEVAETPNISMRRKFVFLFIAGISHELGREVILPHLNLILIPLCREVSDASKTASEELKKDAQEALDIIKTVVGVEDFSAHYALVQSALLKKKIKRKREKAQEAITDPEKFSKRKIKKQQSKKESKKRKILQQKGRRKPKKAKLAHIVIAS